MNRKIILLFTIILFSQVCFCQNNDKAYLDSINTYFNEIEVSTKKHYSLWNLDLYGSLILIDPKTREIYTNEPDSIGMLTKKGNIYTGVLPASMNFANTAIDWNGKKWAMVMLPLSSDKYDRINLLAHELFHREQSKLGFNMGSSLENNHLDKKEGRIYLRLELEALKRSIILKDKKQQRVHLTIALIFRKYRNKLFPQSDVSENALELNEGIAEYTGQVISGRSKKLAIDNLSKSIDKFISIPSYVRSFAYLTTPVYGFLLNNEQKGWNKRISDKTNLTDFFIEEFKIAIPENLEDAIANIQELDLYNASQIIAEETDREAKRMHLIAEYKQIFVEKPHLIIPLERMNISFSTNNLIPLEDKGTVYPTASVSDNWGRLEVSKEMLLSSNWKTIYLSKPLEITEEQITGDGWVINLKNNYKVVSEEGNYILLKE